MRQPDRSWHHRSAATTAGILLLGLALTGIAVSAVLAKSPPSSSRVEVGAPTTPFIFDGDVRDLPRPAEWQPGDPIKEIPRRRFLEPGASAALDYGRGLDPLLEAQLDAVLHEAIGAFTTPSRNFPGQGYTGVSPPDTVGDVGSGHYIQGTNTGGGTRINIYDKAEPVPSLLATFILDTLGTGACASGFGDPIILYDRAADRWMLSEFASSGNNMCLYISQTADPVAGGWFHYGFTAPSFPDYPKFGVWATDANLGQGSYIVTANDGGPGIYALDRGAMLAGLPATFQRLTVPDLPGFAFESPTPADTDGPTPAPPGTPAIIMRHRDTEAHAGPAAPGDVLEMWTFDVDWVTPSNTTLTAEPDIDVADFDSNLCGLTSFSCFPQPGTGTTLDPLREVIMMRVQYMVHDDHESLVGSFVVDVDATDHGGVRWFELRRSGGGWTVHQEGTYSIDADSRWMCPSAMDQSGNITIGYNVSSSATFPSLRYDGRLADDPLGVMTAGEVSIHEGTASSTTNRYGDYASMSLDPTDDCTFWFTGENNTAGSWRTQIASFRFDACGCELAPLPPASSAVTNGDNRIDLSWDDSELGTIIEYRVRRSRTSGGPYETIAVVPDSSPGAGAGAGYSYEDTDVSGTITYYYVVQAHDGAACKSDATNEVNATATGACTLAPLFAGVQSAATPFFATCTLEVTWDAGAAECAGPVRYDVHRSQTAGFTPGPGTLFAAGLTGTSITDIDSLVSGEEYFYLVRAIDESNDIEEPNLVADSPWNVAPSGGNLGPGVYRTGDYGDSTCAALSTPELRLGSASQLVFSSTYDIEIQWDKGEVQITADGGATWERVEVAYPLNSIRTSDACGLPTGTYFTGTDLNWAQYGADLSPWAGADVQLRFLMSSDVAVTASGWWIDDISITQVGLPGTCATSSFCEDNPFVDVQPDGPLATCVKTAAPLTAVTTGGTGSFSYQWTEDGLPIPGATSSTFLPLAPGTHVYNCEVNADTCPDKVRGGFSTEVTTVDTPSFGGIVSATGQQSQTCAVDLAWSAASTICPGPLKYFVYRDTVSPVSPIPDRLVASNLDATSWTDTAGTVSDVTYHYLVQALDQSTARFDGNVVEASATPIAPGTGPQVFFLEDFDALDALDDWTIDNLPPDETCGIFSRSVLLGQLPATGSFGYARAHAVSCGDPPVTTVLTSPSIDLATPNVQAVTLDYDIYYKFGGAGGEAIVEVWDGSLWQEIWRDTDADLNAHQSFDITAFAAGVADFRVRFFYDQADQWFSVDNVVVSAEVVNLCDTVIGPPPAPDGRDGTTPLTAAWDGAPGADIALTWDASSCVAGDYHLLYGDLAGVGAYTLSGSECSVGTGGSFTWTGVPPGDLFFLIIGTDGAGIEGSWGVDSFFGERNGPNASGQCGSLAKDASGSCP